MLARFAVCVVAPLMLAASLGLDRAPAQETQVSSNPVYTMIKSRVESFFEGVSGEAQKAYNVLLAGSPLQEQKQAEAVKALIAKTAEIEKNYGRYRAYERVSIRQVGTDLVLAKYLYKCEKLPVIWYFTFYRNLAPGNLSPEEDSWRVIAVRFDTDLDSLW